MRKRSIRYSVNNGLLPTQAAIDKYLNVKVLPLYSKLGFRKRKR